MYSYANSNSEALLRIAEIYFRAPGMRVLDMTFGKGRFWTDLVDWDIDLVAIDIAPMAGINLRADFRRLPSRAFWLRPDGSWQRDPFATLRLPNGLPLETHDNIQSVVHAA